MLPPHKERQGLHAKARNQLGTVGSGNHYVDVFADEAGTVWVGVHFGSRGFGHTVASGFLALSQDKEWGTKVPEQETLLDLDTPMGQDYWALMQLCGRYAYAGREWVLGMGGIDGDDRVRSLATRKHRAGASGGLSEHQRPHSQRINPRPSVP